jgi:hypothetical protein
MLRAVSLKLKPCNPNSKEIGAIQSNNPLAHRPDRVDRLNPTSWRVKQGVMLLNLVARFRHFTG